MKTFETGKTYQTRSICDHDCIIALTVAKRTAKTITTTAGKTITTTAGKTLRIAEYDGTEYVKPWGFYSMAPMVRAESAI